MNRYTWIIVQTIAATSLAFGTARAATVFIPEGSAGAVVVVDSQTDKVVNRLSELPDVHGLGGSDGSRYLVAGSFSEQSAEDMPEVARPANVSESEHAKHHGAGARQKSPDGAISILTILDASTGNSVRRLEVPGAVHHVSVSPDGRYAVATHPNGGGVSIIDLKSLTVLGFVPTGSLPNYAVFSPDSSRAYVTNSGDGTISEIMVEHQMVRRTLPAGDSPEHIVMNEDGTALYVANVDAGTVSELSVESGDIHRSFQIGGLLHGLDITEDGQTLFVSGNGEDKLSAVDLPSGNIRSVKIGPAPYHLTVIDGTDKLYVSSRDEPLVWVVDRRNLTKLGTIPIEGEGHQMVVLH